MVGHAGIGTLHLGDQGQPVTVDNCEAHQFTRVFGEAARRRLGNVNKPGLAQPVDTHGRHFGGQPAVAALRLLHIAA